MRRLLLCAALAACHHSAPPRAADYAEARRAFRTHLVHEGPSPQAVEPFPVAADAHEMTYASGALQLRAWISDTSGPARPAVVYVHGASAFGVRHWEATRALRDAGFVVMTPILRSENGSPGSFSLFYDEVDDIVAAAEALAKLPGVDPARIYLAGHSDGGTLTMLAAMTSSRFRAAAALSGMIDARALRDAPDAPFDKADPDEYRMRSPIQFPGSFKCPVRIYYGSDEGGAEGFNELAERARAAGRDVAAIRVPGDHDTMKTAAFPLIIEQFGH